MIYPSESERSDKVEYVLGIDGGGTKTRAALADMSGVVIAQATVGPTNPNAVSKQLLKTTLQTLFHSLENQTGKQADTFTNIFAGIAGTGNKHNHRLVKNVMHELVPQNTDIEVEPDPINALYSGTYGKPGIVQISGTGSITYGINSQLQHDRVGGWGYLLGDEGSGYDIGRQGIAAALKSYDGTEKSTTLLANLFTFFNVSEPQELMNKIYASATPKNEIAAFAKIVLHAYKQQDSVAEEIIANVVKGLVASIETLYRKHFQVNEKVEVVLCGGVFNDQEILPRLIMKRLQKIHLDLPVIIPKMPPVGGSLIGAYLSMGQHPTPEIIHNIIHTI